MTNFWKHMFALTLGLVVQCILELHARVEGAPQCPHHITQQSTVSISQDKIPLAFCVAANHIQVIIKHARPSHHATDEFDHQEFDMHWTQDQQDGLHNGDVGRSIFN